MIKLKIDQKKYYAKKSAFKTLYKKLGMTWMENTKIGDVWANPDKLDKAGYIRKIPEEGLWKRFIIHDCPEMVEFLKGIGAVEIADEPFEDVVVKEPESFIHERFGHEKFHKMIMDVGDKLKVKWGLLESEKPPFQKKWDELKLKYANYRDVDLYNEIESKNEQRKRELVNGKGDVVKKVESSEVIQKVVKKADVVDINKKRVVIIKRKKKV